MKTKVIYRQLENECIAIFPELPGTMDPNTCLSYMRVGQHSSCDPFGLARKCRLSTAKERAELARELARIGYRLARVERMTSDMHVTRMSAINA